LRELRAKTFIFVASLPHGPPGGRTLPALRASHQPL
jgi:hypothetical protein